MIGILSSAEVNVVVDYHLFGLHDSEVDETPPFPHAIGHGWLSVGISKVFMESVDDISRAQLRFESWATQPPPLDEADWPVSETVMLELPSGMLSVHQITAGSLRDVFSVGGSGRYQVRLAWREVVGSSLDVAKPQALALAQFWR